MSPTKCASHHFGPWLIEPEWFMQSVGAIRSGVLLPRSATNPTAQSGAYVIDADGNEVYNWSITDGVAVLPIEGAMMKIRSKYGGTSTVDVRDAIRKAVADDRVSSILLHIDSPGGTVAGTDALAADVAAANRIKPVHAHFEDMGASAAYYVASQARRITASPTSLVGSLGVRMEVIDSSQYFADKGLKVHSIATGEYKAAGADGTEITDKQLEYFQGIVNDAVAHFKAAVMRGRGFAQEKTDALFDGRVHDASTAKTLGLIDEVASLDAAMQAITNEVNHMNAEAFAAYAAEHPEAVAKFIEQGKATGLADGSKIERERVTKIIDASKGRWTIADKAIRAGMDADQVTLAVAAAEEVEAKAKADTDAKDKEIARLKFEADGAKGVGVKPTGEAAPAGDIKADAKANWAKMSDEQHSAWANEDIYVRASVKAGRVL